jgi:hypothetical protein
MVSTVVFYPRALSKGRDGDPSVPRSGLFPLRVALSDTAAAESSSKTRILVIALIGGGVLALAILAALLLPRLRRP